MLVLPGQRRLHMKDESEPRKRSIAAAHRSAAPEPRSMTPDGLAPHRAVNRRSACLRALGADAAQRGDAILVLEQDDTLIASDRKLILSRHPRRSLCRAAL